eukprot:7206661-Pyramimonas_sp.AAC.1
MMPTPPSLSCPDTQHPTRILLIRSSARRLKTQVRRDTFAKTRSNTWSQHATHWHGRLEHGTCRVSKRAYRGN